MTCTRRIKWFLPFSQTVRLAAKHPYTGNKYTWLYDTSRNCHRGLSFSRYRFCCFIRNLLSVYCYFKPTDSSGLRRGQELGFSFQTSWNRNFFRDLRFVFLQFYVFLNFLIETAFKFFYLRLENVLIPGFTYG